MWVREDVIVLSTGAQEIVLFKLASIPVAESERQQLDNVLAAIAAAWALGISVDLIRAGTATFEVERADSSAR